MSNVCLKSPVLVGIPAGKLEQSQQIHFKVQINICQDALTLFAAFNQLSLKHNGRRDRNGWDTYCNSH